MRAQTINPDEDQWKAFVAAHPQAHLLQSGPWGQLKSRFGWSAGRVALVDSSQAIVAGAQILYRRLPYGLGKLAYVPKGPLVDWQDAEQTARLVPALDRAARAQGAMALTVEPELPDTPQHAADLARAGFVSAGMAYQPRRTLLVDLRPDEEAILKAMKSKTRYNIRLSARKGVRVHQGTWEDVEFFDQLMAATGARNRFGVRSLAYYHAAFELFAPHGQVALFLAVYEDQPLAGVMVFALGRAAWYLHGGSSNTHRNLMAPYAAQWAAMCWARARGCVTYDLWGVPDEDQETLEAQFTQRGDGLWGVYRSKRGYGGKLFRTVGAWDRVYRPLRYRLYRWAWRWR
jgi:lipid II:glycine glycyltransferase (peptidoglycan interpeptide bridge formation enzyme)